MHLRRDFAVSVAPAAAADATLVCLLMCALRLRPIPVHFTGAGTAGDGCSRETAGGVVSFYVLSPPAAADVLSHTHHSPRQTTNVSACKFTETLLTVKRQRFFTPYLLLIVHLVYIVTDNC